MRSSTKKVFFKDYVFNVWGDVYEPAEDSFLFAENLIVDDGARVLDVGTGCGILTIIAAAKASLVIALDINPYALRCAKENARLNHVDDKIFFVQGDLFTPIKSEAKFDLILFNAPYLPSETFDSRSWLERAWAGGVDGRTIINRFIREVSEYLKKGGRVLLMQSTIAGVEETFQSLASVGLKAKTVATMDLPFFETIVLIEAKN